MALPNDMLCAYAINYTWGTTTEMTCLIGKKYGYHDHKSGYTGIRSG